MATRATGAEPAAYGIEEVRDVTRRIAEAIRAVDPNRLLFFDNYTRLEDTPESCSPTLEVKDVGVVQQFAYGIGEITAQFWSGIDGHESSGYVDASWPREFYRVCPVIKGKAGENKPLILNGCLKAGTEIALHVDQVDKTGTVSVRDDAGEIYSERIKPAEGKDGCSKLKFDGGYFVYQYEADSKTIRFRLDRDTEQLRVAFTGSKAFSLVWSKIEVTLPEAYAVERYWFSGGSDGGPNRITRTDMSSTVTISAESYPDFAQPHPITIRQDCTYATDALDHRIDKQTMLSAFQNWRKVAAANHINAGLCYEFSIPSELPEAMALAYLDDLLSAFQETGIGWVMFQREGILFEPSRIGAVLQPYDGRELDVAMLEVMRKHQSPLDPPR
jgi:hypothetical protein